MRNVVTCLSHSIEEYDQVRLLHSLGYGVFSIGGYIDPANPHDSKRPALPDVPHHVALHEAVNALEVDDNLGAAQAHIPEVILEWADVIIFHHYLGQRLFPQWDHLAEWRAGGGRVIWRTVGQSVENNERQAAPYRADGLEIVRYSPRERNIPSYAGEDVMIRFYKDPAEWSGWTGDRRVVTNVTQDMAGRSEWCNASFWREATAGLPVAPAGPKSEALGGLGEIDLEDMKDLLRSARCYLYTGTQPASYTLGLIEALMTGIPVVSIGPAHMTIFPYGPELFEGHELTGAWSDIPGGARLSLERLLEDDELAALFSSEQRQHAVAGFGMDGVGAAWAEYLGTP